MYPGITLPSVVGEPTTLEDAVVLASTDPYQFQWWALGKVGARPTEQKKGADRGTDGRLYFHEKPNEPTKQVIFSVKAGKVDVSQVRDLRGVIEREKADIGVLISMQEPTRPMRVEAASAGWYMTGWDDLYPRIQLLTVADILSGKGVEYPDWSINRTYRAAPLVQDKRGGRQYELPTPDADAPPAKEPDIPAALLQAPAAVRAALQQPMQPAIFEMPPKPADQPRKRSPRPPVRRRL